MEFDILPEIVSLVKTAEPEVKREAVWSLCNAFVGAAPEDIGYEPYF